MTALWIALWSACFALTGTMAPLALTDSLRIVVQDAALGAEIARAARRYVTGTVTVVANPPAAATTTAADEQARTPRAVRDVDDGGRAAGLSLRVAQVAGVGAGQAWTLVLVAAPGRVVRRSLRLHEVPSRFDLAEAVAIGLPAMMDELSTLKTAGPAEPSPAQAVRSQGPHVPSPPPAAPLGPRPTTTVAAVIPGRGDRSTRRPPAEPSAPAQPAPSAPTEAALRSAANMGPATAAGESPRAAASSPEGTPPASSPAGSAPDSTASRKADSTSTLPRVESAAVAGPLPLTAPLDSPRSPPPTGALVTLGGGIAVLLAGVGTGAAAMQIARQIDQPTGMRFDRALDDRGKALDVATIVLDSVGAAATLAGGTWLLVNRVRARRAAAQVSLRPALAGLAVQGTFQ